jgi:hypothetical protein
MRERWPAEDGDAEASTPEIERKRTRLPPAQPARRRIVRARIENATSATEAQPAKLHQAAADGRNGSR